MNITKENIDALNVVVKVDIVAEDYQEKVNKIFKDYRKKADIPGFRKGRVPMGMLKKQYGKSIIIEEVNKLLEDSLHEYLIGEQLNVIGYPILKKQDNFSWDSDSFSFEFELGLTPEFEINFQPEKKVTHYKVVADDFLLDKEVENLQNKYGSELTVFEVSENSTVTGTFTSQERELKKQSTISIKDIEGEANIEKFVGSEVGEVLELETENLFYEKDKLLMALGLEVEDMKERHFKVFFTIEEIIEIEPADLDQDFFNKSFPEGMITSVTELREKIKEDVEMFFQKITDSMLFKSIIDNLVSNTKFDLPINYLEKLYAESAEKELSEKEAKEELSKDEKLIREELIIKKLIEDSKIGINNDELKGHIKDTISFITSHYRNAIYEEIGFEKFKEKELDDFVQEILEDEDDVKRYGVDMLVKKILTFCKENMSFETKELTSEDFSKKFFND